MRKFIKLWICMWQHPTTCKRWFDAETRKGTSHRERKREGTKNSSEWNSTDITLRGLTVFFILQESPFISCRSIEASCFLFLVSASCFCILEMTKPSAPRYIYEQISRQKVAVVHYLLSNDQFGSPCQKILAFQTYIGSYRISW